MLTPCTPKSAACSLSRILIPGATLAADWCQAAIKDGLILLAEITWLWLELLEHRVSCSRDALAWHMPAEEEEQLQRKEGLAVSTPNCGGKKGWVSLILAVHRRCSFWEVYMAFSLVCDSLASVTLVSHLAAQFGFFI